LWQSVDGAPSKVGNKRREGRDAQVADRYSGYYEHSLDPKGRITIPSKFRDQLGKTIAMMRGKGGCIELYSLQEWNAVYEKFEKIDEDDGEAYDRMRKLLATSVDDNEMDKQGRLLMPTSMRQFAKLEKDVVISGAGRHVEVWNRDDFFRFIEES
jgi:MraZ protein